MKQLIAKAFFILLLFNSTFAEAQEIFTEDFTQFGGNGNPLTGWNTWGFKSYEREGSGQDAILYAETELSNANIEDSLISSPIGPLAENSTISFKSRLVASYNSDFATGPHTVANGDKISFWISNNAGASYNLIRDITTSFVSTGTALLPISIAVNGYNNQFVKFKILVSRTTGSWFFGVDDISIANIDPTEKNKSLLSDNFKVYPNPSSGKFFVTTSDTESDPKVQIYSLLGHLVYETVLDNPKFSFDMSNEKPGIYFLKFISTNGITTKRIVVTR